MLVREIEARGILTPSKLPEVDYCINPYVGCAHGCVYCYARFMKRFTGHTEDWGRFVDVRRNAVSLLQTKLHRTPDIGGRVLLGSVTDAYQPLEEKYGLSRGLLRQLMSSRLAVSILTKSSLLLRDLDLLAQMDRCEVGLSISTADDAVSRWLEPGASSSSSRMAVLRTLRRRKISNYLFLGPIIPQLTDVNAVLKPLVGHIDSVWAEGLNAGSGNWASLEAALHRHSPDLAETVWTLSRDDQYWLDKEREVNRICARFGLRLVGFFRH